MKINLLVRLKNKAFWLTLVTALLLVVQIVASLFGYNWDFVVLNQQIAAIINAVFAVLSILGIVVDPTTAGIGDSQRALTYTEPKVDLPVEDDETKGVGWYDKKELSNFFDIKNEEEWKEFKKYYSLENIILI